jgi:hypothetical protein
MISGPCRARDDRARPHLRRVWPLASSGREVASGSSPDALMTKAGYSNMETTLIYLHLAGIVFRDEAEALKRRLGVALRAEEPRPTDAAFLPGPRLSSTQ